MSFCNTLSIKKRGIQKNGSKNYITLKPNTLLIFVPTWKPFGGHRNPKGTARLKKGRTLWLAVATCASNSSSPTTCLKIPSILDQTPNQPTLKRKILLPRLPSAIPKISDPRELAKKQRATVPQKTKKKRTKTKNQKKKKSREASDLSRVRSRRNYNPSATLQPDLRQPGNPPSTVATPGKPASQPTNQPRFHQPRFLEFIFGFKLHFSAGEN